MGEMTLRQHRTLLAHNPRAYVEDLDRVVDTLSSHLKACGYQRAGRKGARELRREIVELLLATQDGLPLFHVEGALPYCWNAPSGWKFNYIRYEWGHLQSRNQNADAHQLENLALLSARCNQHVQTSMDVKEVRAWLAGSAVATRIDLVLEQRRALFATEGWRRLLRNLQEFM